MQREFWQERWGDGKIAFHQSDVHPMLRAHVPDLIQPGDRILVPLCGKSLDLLHLLKFVTEPGGVVIGVEFVEQAVHDFFRENNLRFETPSPGHFVAGRLEIFCRDFLTPLDQNSEIGPIDFVYDRAALVALPEEMRRAYANNISALCRPGARMLLVTFEYDQSRIDGPPFSIKPDHVRELYADAFEIRELERSAIAPLNPRFAESGVQVVHEVAYELRRKS